MTAEKAALRRQMRRLRAGLHDRDAQSLAIRSHLNALQGPAFIYVSVRAEVDTRPLLGPGVLIPRVEGTAMVAVPFSTLEPGAYQIPTCAGDAWTGPINTILLPGLAFDLRGRRLGYGGGFYDRFCALHPTARRIGLAYSEQLIEAVPTEDHDLAVHAVVTPTGLHRCP